MKFFTTILNIVALLAYLLWSIDVVRCDIESNKIPNRKIILGFKILIVLFVLSFLFSFLGERGVAISHFNFLFYKMFFINFLYAFSAAIVLWYGEIWPAGDAKFFILSIAFLPFINENSAGFPHYLWLSILINIFVIAGVYSLLKFIVETFTLWRKEDDLAFLEIKQAIEKIKNWKSKTPILRAIIEVLVITLSVGIIFTAHQMVNIYLRGAILSHFKRVDVFYFLMFFLWDRIRAIFKSKIWKVILALLYAGYFIFGLICFPYNILTYAEKAFSNVLKFGIILMVGRFIFEYLIERRNVIFVSKEELKPGMILSTKDSRAIKTDSSLKELFEDYFKDGLSPQQVAGLREWLERHPVPNAKLEIIKGKAFALWILLGCLIEIIFNKSVLTWLR